MIARAREIALLTGLLRRNPAVAIVGARQVGKTTLARAIASRFDPETTYLDLENPAHEARLADPMVALEALKGLIIIDEVQRLPDLFPVLRFLVDRARHAAKFLLLGSAAPGMLRQSSESLAGRIVYHELRGFALDEIGGKNLTRLWLRGGFPRAYLARSEKASAEWRRGFIRTFLERDLPQLGVRHSSPTMRRLWTMLAHYHGQTWNASEFARSFGVADTTIRNYLDLLTGAMVVRSLSPWHENLSKRQVKAPKVYIADSGILHTLLGLTTLADLEAHPKVGASWEGFLIEEIIRRLGARPEECFFWATHAGAELDLLVVRGRRRLGFEIKRTVSPRLTPSIRTACEDLHLDRLDVIHAGGDTFPLDRKVRALAAGRILKDVSPLSG